LNVFSSGPNNPATLERAFSGAFVISGENEMRAVNVQLDGPLFTLSNAGDVRAAFGGEHRWERNASFVQVGTSDNLITVFPFEATRKVDSLFGELFIPLVADVPGIRELSLSLAGRWERYSDVGDTTNPKVALLWEPTDGLRFKGTYGTSFRAPYLPESTFQSGGYGIYIANNVQDPLSPTGVSSGISVAGGNDALVPASATTWSAGADWTPPTLPGLRASLYYFNVDYKDQIFALQGNPLVLTDPAYAPYVMRNPTSQQIQDALNFGGSPVPVFGALPANIDFILDGRRQNLGRTKMSGIDFSIAYRWDSDWGTFNTDLLGTYTFNFDQAVAPGAPLTDVLDTLNNPVSLRLRGSLGWTDGQWSAHLFGTHTGGYVNTFANDYPIDSNTTFDIRVARDIDLFGGTTQLSISVNNLFDADPPHTNTQIGYDPYNANAMGRLISFGVRQSF
jgi:iron complex outermembrane receptor protein